MNWVKKTKQLIEIRFIIISLISNFEYEQIEIEINWIIE